MNRVDHQVRTALAIAAIRPCDLCSGPPHLVDLMVPNDSVAWGGRAGKQRLFFVSLCETCAATPPDFQQWRGVEEIMRDEAYAEAEGMLHEAAKVVNELSGILPELVIPYGVTTECLAQLLKQDKDISILVLASGTAKEGPGPLVSMFGKAVQSIPVTIVPGNFTDEQIDALA